LYSLKFEDLNGLSFETGEPDKLKTRSLQEKSVNNILAGIEASKVIPFERVLFALGIRMVGETVAKKLAKHFKTMDALIAADKETILGIHEIGEKIAEQCIKHFSEAANINIINQLKEAGLNFEIVEEIGQETTNKLEGRSFLVSGTFTISRDDLKK
jgi:DNA ligase (NAD+)